MEIAFRQSISQTSLALKERKQFSLFHNTILYESSIMNIRFVLFLAILSNAHAFSEQAQLTRGRLYEALRSPSGKLTYSPEIIIPEPSDPTALLLQGNEVKKIS